MRGRHGSRWTLLLGLTVLGVIFLGAALVGTKLIQDTVARTRALQERSINSVEVVSRIVHDLDQERILVDDHIHVDDLPGMEDIERKLSSLAGDLQRSSEAYELLVEPGDETELWQRARTLIARYLAAQGPTLQLSRSNRNQAAVERMNEVRSDYVLLEDKLFQLIQVNHGQAIEATKRIESMQRRTEAALWVGRIATLVGLGLLGWWMVRRVSGYERQITEHSRLLEERNHDLDAFAGRVAHDIKNALGPMALAPALLRRTQGDARRVLETADRIERSSRRATAVVDALLAFSRASQRAAADEAAGLRAVMGDVLDELAPRAAELDVTVELEELPDVQLRCSPGLLQIVLANLCGNAVKYLQGQPDRRVRVTARLDGEACRVDVVDTGPGIPKEAQPRIFEPFFRVEGTQPSGTGIGLATVRRIVDARGGRVGFESAPGRGSRFHVWLPLAAPVVDRPPQGAPSTAPAARR